MGKLKLQQDKNKKYNIVDTTTGNVVRGHIKTKFDAIGFIKNWVEPVIKTSVSKEYKEVGSMTNHDYVIMGRADKLKMSVGDYKSKYPKGYEK